jgi:hypothetical protein
LSSCHSISIPISECKQAGGGVAGGFRWTIQHGFLPFVPDWRYVAWRSLAVACGVLVLIVICLRTHRLAPLIVAHWLMDIVGGAHERPILRRFRGTDKLLLAAR